ncbi:MAG: hypothetical protein CM15mP113_0200 [Pseudomonadota bacterium]|nr:MAG: hypothetical protein CM15mP113_0200 [Pseudomonadota bacterium]
MIATDASASDISDKIKERLYAKAAEYVDAARPEVAASLFGGDAPEAESNVEVKDETTIEPETDEHVN